jgi:hypothetical protein
MLLDNGCSAAGRGRSGRYPLRLRSSMARVTALRLISEESARAGVLGSVGLGGKPSLSRTSWKRSATGRRIGVGPCVHSGSIGFSGIDTVLI